MNDKVAQDIMMAENKLHAFTLDPKGNDKNYLLGSVLEDINDIDIKSSNLSESDYHRFRLSLLMLHLNVLQEFDNYYIHNYNPEKKFFLHLMPPLGAVNGPIFGSVDPAEIKDEKVRSAYEKDLAENSKLGKEIALQGELSALKLKLSIYNNDMGVISDAVNFIRRHYANSAIEQAEVARTINGVFHGSEREKQILKSLYDTKK